MEKLEIKDLINVGVFGVLYFVIFYAVGMLQVIPVMYALSPLFLSIVGGIPLMLFITRVDKFGMLSLMGIIVSILLFLMGMSYLAVITGIIFPIIGDYIMKLGDYKVFSKIALGTGIFSLWCFGGFLPLWLFREETMAMYNTAMGPEYTQAVFALAPEWSLIVYLLAIIVGGIIGAYLGRAILKKHFERAGIA